MIYKRGGRLWVQYHHDGQRYRESVQKVMGANTMKAARTLERKRLGEIEAGTWIGLDDKRVRLSDLRQLIDADYQERQRKSGDRVARAWKHLEAFFRHDPRAASITTNQLHKYVANRREEGAAPSTIRNELTALRRAFRVAVAWKRLRSVSVPTFPEVAVKNARDEFYAEAEVQTVHAELPDALKNLWVVASWTGWRRNELFNLTWARVDLEAGVVRLDVNETKNDEGREVPFDVVPELVQAFREQRKYTTTVERATGQICPWVFHRKGKRIKRMDVARQRACERAGVIAKDGRPKTLHDMRRTAIRRLTRAGVPRHITMRIVGLRSEAVFRRYSIVETEDLRDGFAKVLAFKAKQSGRQDAAVGDA